MQNASTAAATATDARVTEDAGSQVIFSLVVEPSRSIKHFPSSLVMSGPSLLAHLSSVYKATVTLPPVVQAVALTYTDTVGKVRYFVQAFKAVTKGLGRSDVDAVAVVHFASVYVVNVTAAAAPNRQMAAKLIAKNFMVE